MSEKQTKKQRKELRRVIRPHLTGLGKYLKPRPWYIPKFIWNRLKNIILKLDD